MDVSQYIKNLKEIEVSLLNYIESQDRLEDYKKDLINLLIKNNINNNKHELKLFLHLLSSIANNHHRTSYFFIKIENIIHYLQLEIQKYFSNTEIFEIFKENNRIILFLINENIIFISNKIVREIQSISYFKSLFDEEYNLQSEIGENDSYICSLIRQDSVVEFISYVNRTNLCLSNCIINTSIFETNCFLINKYPTILEYATFFGAIQIIQYMIMNHIELTSSLWLYAIHSNCPQIIHLLEDYHVDLIGIGYLECYKEAVKCHHNDIACYFRDNFINEEDFELVLNEYALSFYNFVNFPDNFEPKFIFNFLCKFDYYTFVYVYLKNHKVDLKETMNPILIATENNNFDIVYLILSQAKTIEIDCFKGCNKIQCFTVPKPFSECIKSIKNNAFALCTSLKYIEIPSSVTSIGDGVFDGCCSLERIIIPHSVVSIGENAFNQCSSLTYVSIFSWSLNAIKSNTFNMCKSLKEIIIRPLVKRIEKNAFNGCSSLYYINIPSTLLTIGERAFCGCSSLNQIKCRYSLTKSPSEQIEIPSSVVKIGEYAFSGCKKIEKIKIPFLVTEISNGTFSNCLSLTNIIIPESVTKIGDYSFENCELLKYIKIPSSVTSIGNGVFDGCCSLERITIPPSVVSIGKNVFIYCFSLKQVSIFSWSLNAIKSNTFNMCESLKEIIIPPPIKSIEKNAFNGCSSLYYVNIPSTLLTIGERAFCGCSSLNQIKCGDFYNKSPSEQIEIPSSVVKIGEYAFSGCKKIERIKIPFLVTEISNGTFNNCLSLTNIIIPESVTKIGDYSFDGCSSLYYVDLPPSLSQIGLCAFRGCYFIKQITIPPSVSQIGTYCFDNNSSINDIQLSLVIILFMKSVFCDCTDLNQIKFFNIIIDLNKYIDIDDYNIDCLIATSKHSDVYKVTNKFTNKQFAFKIFPNCSNDVEYFLDSVNSSPKIDGVLQIRAYCLPLTRSDYDILIENGINYNDELNGYIIATDFMMNGSLADNNKQYLNHKIKSSCKINPTIRSKIIYGIARIMNVLHENNISDIDLSNGNILLDKNFEPLINISSISKLLYCESNDEFMMNLAYTAPEVILDIEKRFDFPADVYSFATFVYRMFSASNSLLDSCRSPRHYIQKKYDNEKLKRPYNIPDCYWDLIQKCWDEDPDERITFSEIVDFLKNDIFALNENEIKTNINELHEYQMRF